MANGNKVYGGEFFQTDTRLVFGAYFCKETGDGSYTAKMYGCDAILDHQSNIPMQRYKSRREIRKTLAELLEAVSEGDIPEDGEEETLILETRQQLQKLLLLLNSDGTELPALLPDNEVQAKLEEALNAAIEITQGFGCNRTSDSSQETYDTSPTLSEEQGGRVDLDQSAIQKLKSDFQEMLSDFNAIIADLRDGSIDGVQAFPKLSRSYNSLVLYAVILEENGYKITSKLRNDLSAYIEQMCALSEEMGGDMLSVRTLRGTPRPFPSNQSSLDELHWNALMQQYDEAVHQMAIAEHIAERLIPRFGVEYAYRMLIEAYNAFIKSAKEVQKSTGTLKHYKIVKKALAPQLHRLAEAIEFPMDDLETM